MLLENMTLILSLLLTTLMPIWGFTRVLVRSGRVEAPFAPLTVIAVQTLVTFIAGISGIPGAMRCAAMVMQAVGIVLLAASFSPAMRPAKENTSGACIVFALTAAWVIYASIGQKVLHCDNFTHWAQIVKVIVQNDALPTADDAVITFTSYPPGTAFWIYYAVCAIGDAPEWMYIAAQGLLIAACVTAVCAVLPENRVVYVVGAFVFGIACTVFSEQIYELLVDGVLGALSSACLFYIINRRRRGMTPNGLVLGCLMALLVIVKNSGILFAVLLAALAYIPVKKTEIKDVLVCVLIAATVCVIWRVHVKMTFADTSSAKHDVSIAYYTRIFGTKTVDDIMRTVRVFAARTWRKRRIRIAIIVMLIVRLLTRRDSRELPACVARMPFVAAAFYCVYLAGMLCVYIFSMRQSEALSLGGYFRYFKTMEIVLVGMEICYITSLAERIARTHEKRRVLATAASCVMMLAWLACAVKDCEPRFLLKQVISDDDPRIKAEQALEVYNGGAILVCDPGDVDYYPELITYLTGTTDVHVFSPESASDIEEKVTEGCYIIFPEGSAAAEEYMEAHGYTSDVKYIY